MLYVFDLFGVAVFAFSGALSGVKAGLDLFGIAVVAAVTAIGGGTIRDLLLNRHPIFWINDPKYLYLILAVAIATAFAAKGIETPGYLFIVADAFGLALFAITGAQVAERERHSAIIAVLTGTMTGVAGGVLRDLLSGTVPLILRKDIYATAAIAGIVVYLVLQKAGLKPAWAGVIGMVIIVSLRLAALEFGWQLPTFAATP